MKKFWWLILIILLGGLIFTGLFFYKNDRRNEVIIKDKSFQVELASSATQREQGLSHRESLEADQGMLFVFPSSEIHNFWMKDTLIPLDVIWINENKIVEMTTLDPATEEYTPSYTPKNKANYVLELNAGTITENDFKIGDTVKIKL